MKLIEIKEKIQSGEITVDFGKAFIYLKNPIAFLLKEIDKRIADDIRHEEWSQTYHAELEAKGEGHDRFLLDKTKDYDEYFFNEQDNYMFRKNDIVGDVFKIHSWMIAEYLPLSLKDNVLSFLQFNHAGFKLRDPSRHHYIAPAIPDDISEPATDYINIPSGKLLFTNRFPESVNPNPKQEHEWNYSINGTLGCKNMLHHNAQKNGVMMGVLTNTSVSVYATPDRREFIIAYGYLDEMEEQEEWEVEEDYPYDDGIAQSSKELLAYIAEHKMDNLGNISCGVWRWEATDYDKGIKALDEDEDVIVVEVPGNRAKFTHYYGKGITPSELGENCWSRIWIE